MEGGRCCGASVCTPVARCPHLRRGMGVDAVIWFWASLPPRALRRGGGVSGGGAFVGWRRAGLVPAQARTRAGPSGLQGVFSSRSSLLLCSPAVLRRAPSHRHAGALQASRLPLVYVPSDACLSAALFSSTVLFFFLSRQQ